jgi:hypothetical protein
MSKNKKIMRKSIKRKSIKRKSIKRKSIKRKSIKRKSIKRKSIKHKSINKRKSNKIYIGGTPPYYGKGIEAPIVTHLPIDNEIVKFSNELKDQLITEFGVKNYDKIGWFRKIVRKTDIPTSCFGLFKANVSNFIINTRLPYIIGLISDILNENGLYVVEDPTNLDINVEIHYANANDEPIGSGLTIHQDNDGGITGNLHTFIVYLDIECEGGKLEIYDDTGRKILDTIDVNNDKPNEKKIVMFNGGLYHRPTAITKGKRVIVSYQIMQKSPEELNKRTPKIRGGGNPDDLESCPNLNYDDGGDGNEDENNWSA